ncbi:MAG: hypothetical protein LBS28_05270 [Streptococcaceae bacterium]|jgi:hypothetical protein|nr:hypothetical protein [Streptococcaceae bacterium]
MSEKIVLLGGGGHCKSVLDTLLNLKHYDDIVICGKKEEFGKSVLKIPIKYEDNDLIKLLDYGYDNAFITLSNVDVRKKIFKMLKKFDYILPNIIDSSANVSDFANLSEGTFVGKNP